MADNLPVSYKLKNGMEVMVELEIDLDPERILKFTISHSNFKIDEFLYLLPHPDNIGSIPQELNLKQTEALLFFQENFQQQIKNRILSDHRLSNK